MEVRPFIEQLEQFEDCYAGGLGERTSQEALAGLFRRLGFRARVEGCVCHTNPGAIWFMHAVIMAAGGMLGTIGWLTPWPGIAVTAIALISMRGEAHFRHRMLRWFVPKGISSNMIARKPDAEENARILFVAHGDVARRGWVHSSLWSWLFQGAAGRWKVHPERLALVMGWIQLCLLLLRIPDVFLYRLDQALLVPLGFFTIILLLSVDWMRPRPAAGANDNGSGLAVLAALAEYYSASPPKNAEVCFLVTGSREADAGGMDAFLKTFGRTLPPDSTFVVNVDEVGGGQLCFGVAERTPGFLPYHPLLPGLASATSRARLFRGVKPVTLFGISDAGVATRHGYTAITLKGLKNGRPATPIHTLRDRIRRLNPAAITMAFRYCLALTSRLDEELGREDLTRKDQPPAPPEALRL